MLVSSSMTNAKGTANATIPMDPSTPGIGKMGNGTAEARFVMPMVIDSMVNGRKI